MIKIGKIVIVILLFLKPNDIPTDKSININQYVFDSKVEYVSKLLDSLEKEQIDLMIKLRFHQVKP